MLLFRTLFIVAILLFTSVQCFSQAIEGFFRSKEKKVISTSEVLSNLVKKRLIYGLKDYKNSVEGLHLPEIKNKLKDVGRYVVLELDILESETHELLKRADGIPANLYGYRVRSPSDYSIENAGRCVILIIGVKILMAFVKYVLIWMESPSSHIF